MIGQVCLNLHAGFLIRSLRPSLGFRVGFVSSFVFVLLGPHDVDRGGVKPGLDVRRVVFLDHLDAGAAVLGDLVDVGTLHQAQADVGVPQAVGRAGAAFAVEAEAFLIEDGLEKLALPLRKDEVGGSGRAPWFARDSGDIGRFRGPGHAMQACWAEPRF
jgi:hypothetical protein